MSSLKISPLLRNRSLNLFLFARVALALSMQMAVIAVGWQIYSLTDKPLYLGLVGLIQFLPMFFLTLVVGYVADRYNRRLIVSLCQALEGISLLVLAYESFTGGITKEKILIMVFIIGTVGAFQGPPMQTLLPNIVPKEIFPKAAALSASVSETATIIGPALGGILYALGPGVVYSVSGLLSIITSVLIFLINIKQEQTKREPVTMTSMFAGISFIKSRPLILGAISMDLFAVLFGGATAMLPVYASKILMIGPFGLGILRSTPAVGALLMSAFLAHHPLKRNVGHIMFGAVTVFGLSTILFAVSTSIVVSLVALFLLGASDVISVVIRSTLVQMETPDSMRGRVSSVNLLFIGTSNQLGEFESGITANFLGVVPAVVLGGIGTIAVVILWTKLFPQLYNVDKLVSTDK